MMIVSHTISPGRGHSLPDEERRAHLRCSHCFASGVLAAAVPPLNENDDSFSFSSSQSGYFKTIFFFPATNAVHVYYRKSDEKTRRV